MSDTNHFSGEIRIEPPLTPTDMKRCPQLQEVTLNFTEDRELSYSEDAEIVRRRAVAIGTPAEWCRGGHIIEDIQALVDEYGATHAFTGFIEVLWDPGYGNCVPERFMVIDGRPAHVKARLVWPGESLQVWVIDDGYAELVAHASLDGAQRAAIRAWKTRNPDSSGDPFTWKQEDEDDDTVTELVAHGRRTGILLQLLPIEIEIEGEPESTQSAPEAGPDCG